MTLPSPAPSHKASTVYVSYSHDSPEHQERVVMLADHLRDDGILVTFDKYEPGPAQGWPRWIEEQLRNADFVLMVCTETYRRRFDGEEEPGRGQGITYEGKIIRQLIYEDSRDSRKQKWVPVLFDRTHTQYVPDAVRAYTYHDLSTPSGYRDLLGFLSGDADVGPAARQHPAPSQTADDVPGSGDGPRADDEPDDEPDGGTPFETLAESGFTPGAWAVLQVARRLGASRRHPQAQVCTVRRVVASLILWGLGDERALHTGQWLAKQIGLDDGEIKQRLGQWYPAITHSDSSFGALLDTGPDSNALSTNLVETIEVARRLADSADTQIAARHLLAAAVRRRDGQASVDHLLRVFRLSADEVRARMLEHLPHWGVADDPEVWARLLDQVAPVPDERGVPVYAADSAIGPDLIGITREVEAMASLVCAWSVEPPLSIGLFGEWGSGKSFFMQKIKERVRQIASAARKSGLGQKDFGYYKNIVQVEFNAWHYVEGNLWASLVEHIFTNLRLEGIGEEDVDSEEYLNKRLEKLLAEVKDKTATAEQSERMADEARRDAQARTAEAERLATEAAAARERARTAEEDQRLAEQQAAVKQQQADSSVAARESLGIKDVIEELAASDEIRSQVQADLERLGFTQERMRTVQGLRDALREASESGTVLAEGVKIVVNDPGRWWLLAPVLAVPAAVAGLVWVGAYLTAQENAPWLQSITGGVSTVATVAASVVAFYKRYAPRLQPFVAIVDRLKQKRQALEESIEQAREDRVTRAVALDQDVRAKRQEAADAARRATEMAAQAGAARQAAKDKQDEADRAAAAAQAARTEADRVQGEAEMLRPERRIAAFIQDRAGATDYRRHLGVPALVRRDFEKLSAMFHSQRVAEKQSRDAGRNDLAIVNRVILYIDDLDRCPPQKVVEVLRAIHLLLAFPLFVVVVAVDARWMKRSLRDRFSLMLTRPEGGHLEPTAVQHDDPVFGRTATPDDYLEKIFQVPFWIRPLSKPASTNLVNALTKEAVGESPPSEPSQPGSAFTDTRGARGEEQEPAQTPAPDEETVSAKGPSSPEPPTATPPVAADAPGDQKKADSGQSFTWSDVEPKPRTLQLTKDERDYMIELASIIGRSPRSVKRFVNCYRLLKSALDPKDLARVTGDGTVQTVMLLLGLVTGLPDVAPALLMDLRQAEKSELPVAWAQRAGTQLKLEGRREWEDVLLAMKKLTDVSQVHTIRPLLAAADLVDRFSFSPVRMLAIPKAGARAPSKSPVGRKSGRPR